MNEPGKFDQLQPVYPTLVNPVYQDDEISLVDLWIELSRYKRQFFGAFSALALVGLLGVFFVFNEKYTLTSAIQMGSYSLNGSVTLLESPEALKTKLDSVIVPSVTSEWLDDNPRFSAFSTEVKTGKDSDVLLIQHRTGLAERDAFQRIQQQIISRVLSDHEQKIRALQVELRGQLQLEQGALDRLLAGTSLQIQLDKEQAAIRTLNNKLERLQGNQELLQRGGETGFLQSLPPEQREQVMTRDGALVDELLKLRFDRFLLDNRMQQQDLLNSMRAHEIRITEFKQNHQEAIDKQKLVVSSVEQKLGAFNKTHLINEPTLSTKPTGLTRPVLSLLVVVASAMGAFVVMLLLLFGDKVRQRREETA